MFMCKEMSGLPLFQDGSCTMRSREAIVTYVIIFERGLQLFVELLVKEFVHRYHNEESKPFILMNTIFKRLTMYRF